MTDADVISRSLTQPEVFVELFERHHDVIHRYLHRRVGCDVADDLAAEVFVQAFRWRHRFRPAWDGGALPWLFGISGNLLSGHRRREQRHLQALGRVAAASAGSDWTDEVILRLDAAVERPALAEALAALRPAEREVLLLHALGDLTYAEMAIALAVPVGTVRSRLSRARARVRRNLATPEDRAAPTGLQGDAHA